MTTFCGKTVCTVNTPNDNERVVFFNAAIDESSSISYQDNSGAIKYVMTLSGKEKQEGRRCLHYRRFKLGDQVESTKRVVPFADLTLAAPTTQPSASAVSPLYETITPNILDMDGTKNDSVLFWSNWSSDDVPMNSQGRYVYSTDSIYKFDEFNLEDADLEATSTRVLCSAHLSWEFLSTTGGLVQDTGTLYVPIIRSVIILLVQNDGMIVDFSAGSGSGSGMARRHNHSNNDQCGFAYGVAAPGTSLQPINWA